VNHLLARYLGTNERPALPASSDPAQTRAPGLASGSEPEAIDLEEIPRYPPFAKGLPVATVGQLLGSQAALIGQLQQELALGTDDDGTPRWATYIEPVIRRYAAFVHLIPASEAHHHCGSGGLLRHGLEVAFRATRLSRGVLVARDRPREQQLQIEPRFATAAALAGLLHDAGKAIADVTATDRDGQWTWNPHQDDLIDWAKRQGLRRYFLHWRAGRVGAHEGFNLVALRRVLPPSVDAWLSRPDPRVYVGFLSAITRVPNPSPLVELVRKADRSSVEQDLKENRIAPLETAVGVPLERYLIDGMRRLLHEGRWTVNQPGARVWLLREGGLHLVWPAAARDLTEQLAQDGLPGIPRDPDTLAELLIERGLVVAQDDPTGQRPTWHLAPAPLRRRDGSLVWLYLLRLSDPGVLFPFGAPPPVDALDTTDATTALKPATGEAVVATTPVTTMTNRAAQEEGAHTLIMGAPAMGAVPDSDDVSLSAAQSERRASAVLAAETRLRALVTHSAELLNHLDQLAAAEGEAVTHRDGLFWLRYPDWFAEAGWSPQVAAEALSGDGLIEPDPATPMRRVRDHAGVRWIVLNSDCSDALQAWLDARAPERPMELPIELPRERPTSTPAQTSATARAEAPFESPGDRLPEQPEKAQQSPLGGLQTNSTPRPRVGVEKLDQPVIDRLILELGPADGHQERALSRSALQALAKQHGFGVYRLREALLGDERVRAQGTQLLIRR